jgi:putative flippase GtrA
MGMKKLLNKETVLYLIFGVLTTVVNYIAFALGIRALGESFALLSNTIAFIVAVAFAYITNKLFVFESKSWKGSVLVREIPSFIGARLVSFGLEQLGLFIFNDLLHISRYALLGINGLMIVKLGLNVIVVILNYIFSKLFIFKKS